LLLQRYRTKTDHGRVDTCHRAATGVQRVIGGGHHADDRVTEAGDHNVSYSSEPADVRYERQGGSVSILVCDDGLQLLPKDEVEKRKSFYFDNNIGYVARPGHNVDGFLRKGRFKKAGNMNFANALSLRVEEIMDDLRPVAQETTGEGHFWTDLDENTVYEAALDKALEESKIAWASGNIRIGSIILIIDSDTRVPEDCFADACVGDGGITGGRDHPTYVGCHAGAHHFFENGVAHFTKGIQHAIAYVCAGGEGEL